MTFKRLSSREKSLLFLAAGVLTFFIYYMLLLEPAITQNRQINEEIALKEASLRRAIMLMSKKEQIRRQYQRYAEQARMTGTEEEEMGRVLKDIESLSAGLVSFTSIKPRSVIDQGFYKQFVVEAESDADIKDLTQFIYKLENSGKMLRVVRLRLSTRENGSALLRASMRVSRVMISQK